MKRILPTEKFTITTHLTPDKVEDKLSQEDLFGQMRGQVMLNNLELFYRSSSILFTEEPKLIVLIF